jgi:hypothetical protein
MPRVHFLPVSEPFRQIPPRNACPISIQYRLHEQAIILSGYANMTFTARQQILDAIPLVVT